MKIYLVTDKSYDEGECVLVATTTKRAALKYIADEMETATRHDWAISDESKEVNTWGAAAGRELNKLLWICGADGNAAVDLFDTERLKGVAIEETDLFTDLYREVGCAVRPDRYEVMPVVEAISEYKQARRD